MLGVYRHKEFLLGRILFSSRAQNEGNTSKKAESWPDLNLPPRIHWSGALPLLQTAYQRVKWIWVTFDRIIFI